MHSSSVRSSTEWCWTYDWDLLFSSRGIVRAWVIPIPTNAKIYFTNIFDHDPQRFSQSSLLIFLWSHSSHYLKVEMFNSVAIVSWLNCKGVFSLWPLCPNHTITDEYMESIMCGFLYIYVTERAIIVTLCIPPRQQGILWSLIILKGEELSYICYYEILWKPSIFAKVVIRIFLGHLCLPTWTVQFIRIVDFVVRHEATTTGRHF